MAKADVDWKFSFPKPVEGLHERGGGHFCGLLVLRPRNLPRFERIEAGL
jgi:hypothetical protein